jgi:adenylate cyclase
MGLTEDIITDLAQLPSVDVISLASVRGYRDHPADLAQLRAELAVTHVMRGSVRGDAEQIRVTTQFLDAASGKELWAERFDRSPDNVLALQDELAVRVVEALALEMVDADRERWIDRSAVNPEALVLYRQAMDLVNPPGDPARNQAAMLSFQQVIELDPDFAGGYAGAAYAYAFRALFRLAGAEAENIQQAKALAEESFARSDGFGMAFTALAFAYLAERDFAQAVASSTRAVAASPGDPYVQTYHGIILAFDGQPESGLAFAHRALRLDPLSERAPYLNILGTIYLHAGQPEEALDALQRSARRGGPSSARATLTRASLQLMLGDDAEALAELAAMEDFPAAAETAKRWTRRSFRRPADQQIMDEPLNKLAVLRQQAPHLQNR